MTLTEFKRRVREAFGPQMENATPANVREFLDRLAHERWQEEKAARAAWKTPEGRIEIDSAEAATYEEILRRFFADILQSPNEQAVIQLWVFALDMAYAGLEEHYSAQMGKLFDDAPEEDGDDHD